MALSVRLVHFNVFALRLIFLFALQVEFDFGVGAIVADFFVVHFCRELLDVSESPLLTNARCIAFGERKRNDSLKRFMVGAREL